MTKRRTCYGALLAFVLAALVAAACSSGGGEEGAEAEPATEIARRGGADAADESGAGAQPASSGGVSAAPRLPALGARIIQTASLRISVPRGGFEDAVERARTVAAGLGGFVVSSSASQGGHGRLVQGALVVRVPGRQYARAMSSLRKLGRLEAREEGSEDVSPEFVDLEARARHLEAVERQLLELLNRARTVSAALAVQSELNETQLELEQVRGRLRFLEDQTAFATISLSIRERLAAPVADGDGGWGIVEAWREGAQAFVRVAGKAFVVLAGAAPIVLLVGLALLGARVFRRRPFFRWGAPGP